MIGKLRLATEFLLISISTTFVVYAVRAPAAAPAAQAQAQAPMPTAEQIADAVAHADAQALAVNGRR